MRPAPRAASLFLFVALALRAPAADPPVSVPGGVRAAVEVTAMDLDVVATKDGRPVFGQIFMWAGYTGVHFNVIADVVPAKGHRLVYQTYPGGIHSGTDYYMNAAGILIGETTVAQTPWNIDGTPMSNRIRKAAQYASSIDDGGLEFLEPGAEGSHKP